MLSPSTHGVSILSPDDAVSVAPGANDELAEITFSNPARFQAFADLPTPDPGAATELERVITRLGFRNAMM